MRSIRIRKQFLKKRYLHIFLVEVLSQQNFKGSQLPGQSWDRYWINAGPILSLGTTIRFRGGVIYDTQELALCQAHRRKKPILEV